MIDSHILNILERYLKEGSSAPKGNISFYCPFCHHAKKKLQVQLDPTSAYFGSWHCWVCNSGGHSIESLLSAIKINSSVLLDVKQYIDANIRKKKSSKFSTNLISGEQSKLQFLPAEFKSLLLKDLKNPEYKNALHYVLKKRKLKPSEIIRYNIGYCDSGRYAKRIIIPSYDLNGDLNFFTGRGYYDEDPLPYLTPSWNKRDMIGFEMMINWKLPIALFEGPFDAIAFRQNAIPLFGKTISNRLRLRIIEEKVSDIFIGLDQDAIIQSIEIIEEFYKQGLNVFFLKMNKKDAGEEGYENLMQIKDNCERIKFSDIIKMKLH